MVRLVQTICISNLAVILAIFSIWIVDVNADRFAVNFSVVRSYPHRTDCFTEGLFLNGTNEVVESCGLTGKSYLRRYDLETGTTVQQATVPRDLFSEGLAAMGKSLYMLTYRSHVLVEYNTLTFKEIRRHPFPYGEGWGLTSDGCHLFLTTGSSYLFRLRADADTGELVLVNKLQVRHRGKEIRRLNEMEYVTPKLWVNQWLTNTIWRVDPSTGEAEAYLSVQGLRKWHGDETPNGIAYSMALGEDKLLVTGKLWPKMFLLQIAPSDLCGKQISPSLGFNTTALGLCPSAPPSACKNELRGSVSQGARTENASDISVVGTSASEGSRPQNARNEKVSKVGSEISVVGASASEGSKPQGSVGQNAYAEKPLQADTVPKSETSSALASDGRVHPGILAGGMKKHEFLTEDFIPLTPLPSMFTFFLKVASTLLFFAACAVPYQISSQRQRYKVTLKAARER